MASNQVGLPYHGRSGWGRALRYWGCLKGPLREEREQAVHRSRGNAPGRTKTRNESPRQEKAWFVQQTRMLGRRNRVKYEGLGEAGGWPAPTGT